MASALHHLLKEDRTLRRLIIGTIASALLLPLLVTPLVRPASTPANPSWEEYPVRGIDISAHNGTDIDFEAVREQGFRFVIIKASEGSDFKDRRFLLNIAHARRAGLKVGAYHFFRFDITGYQQALNFIHSLQGQELDLPIVIDVEQWTNPQKRTRRVVATLLDFITRLQKRGFKVMLYTNKKGYDEFLKGHFDDYPLWIASMTNLDPAMRWTLWQYSHRGTVNGINGSVDLDVYNGSQSQWETWCRQMMQ